MEQNKYIIGEKEYTRQELLAFGKQHYPKFYWIPRGVGLGLIATAISSAVIYAIFALTVHNETLSLYFLGVVISCAIVAIAGAICFAISFRKQPDEAYVQHAYAYYEKVYANEKARQARLEARQAKIARKQENKDVSQLIKYKELLDKGIITQEEYDAKKKELL
jgi:hypothetical protein